jgi:surface protein
MSTPNNAFVCTNENIREKIREYLNGNPNGLPPIGEWDVSRVTNMSQLFEGASSFNEPINNWNVTNVQDMASMFKGASSFNQPLNNWNVTNVDDMDYMFQDATSFNQPLNNWNITNVEGMNGMFKRATSFNQDLSMWELNQTEIRNMFQGAQSMSELFKPLRVRQRRQRQTPTQLRPIADPFQRRQTVDPFQVHREFNKIDLTKLLDILAPERIVTEVPEASNFARFIGNSLKDMINESIRNEEVKMRLRNGVDTILQARINRLDFSVFPPLLRQAIYYSLNYIKTLPADVQEEFIEAYVKDCVNAYDGSDGMTCAGGALERIIKLLEVACTSIISSNSENANTKKCENIIAVLNNDINKLISEAILDWYREHRQGTPGEFPSTMSIEDKKENLRQYLISKFPTNESRSLINIKIDEFESSIGFEHDDFTYGGRKRRGTLRRKYKKSKRITKKRRNTNKRRTNKKNQTKTQRRN